MSFKCQYTACIKFHRHYSTQKDLFNHMMIHACQWEVVDKVTGGKSPCAFMPKDDQELYDHVQEHISKDVCMTKRRNKTHAYCCPFGNCNFQRHQAITTHEKYLEHLVDKHAPNPHPAPRPVIVPGSLPRVKTESVVSLQEIPQVRPLDGFVTVNPVPTPLPVVAPGTIPHIQPELAASLQVVPQARTECGFVMVKPVPPTPSGRNKKRSRERDDDGGREVKRQQPLLHRYLTPPVEITFGQMFPSMLVTGRFPPVTQHLTPLARQDYTPLTHLSIEELPPMHPLMAQQSSQSIFPNGSPAHVVPTVETKSVKEPSPTSAECVPCTEDESEANNSDEEEALLLSDLIDLGKCGEFVI